MKTILLIMLIAIGCNAQQQGNFPIPENYIGTWINQTANDSLVITNTSITWTSNEAHTFVSYGEHLLHTEPRFFSFRCYPVSYILSLEQSGRSKLIFFAQTLDGYERANGVYIKTGTRR